MPNLEITNVDRIPIPAGYSLDYCNGTPIKLGDSTWSVVYLGTDDLTREKVAIKAMIKVTRIVTPEGKIAFEESKGKAEIDCFTAIYGKQPYGENERETLGLGKRTESKKVSNQRYIDSTNKHENVILAKAFAENMLYHCVVMEYFPGMDLYDYLTQRDLSNSQKKIIFQEIVKGYNFCAERGVIHRDIKLENVLVSSDGRRVLLIDFNLSLVIPSNKFDTDSYEEYKTADRVGTLNYAAPEIMLCKLQDSMFSPYVADSYSLGVLLYALFTHEYPVVFDQNNHDVEKFMNDLKKPVDYSKIDDPNLLHLLQSLLNKNVDERLRIWDILQHPWFRTL